MKAARVLKDEANSETDGPAGDGSEAANPLLSGHILPTSGTMVGVCTTLVGLVKIAEGRIGPSHVDEASALVALIFLASAITSYSSIRLWHRPRLSARLERTADILFLGALFAVAIVSLFFAYEII